MCKNAILMPTFDKAPYGGREETPSRTLPRAIASLPLFVPLLIYLGYAPDFRSTSGYRVQSNSHSVRWPQTVLFRSSVGPSTDEDKLGILCNKKRAVLQLFFVVDIICEQQCKFPFCVLASSFILMNRILV